MTILFDATRAVNRNRAFGRGLAPYRPQHSREPYTQADLDWLAADTARREAEGRDREAEGRDREAPLDLMAGEAEALARLEMGLCC